MSERAERMIPGRLDERSLETMSIEEKRALLRRLLRDRELRSRTLPLSPTQSQIWFLAKWNPASPAYNLPAAFRVSGPLDLHALERSLAELVRRHEVLRTAFFEEQGRPVQRTEVAAEVALGVIDLSGLPRETGLRIAHAHIAEQSHRPFQLDAPPLLRCSCVRIDEQSHVLTLLIHHLISDDWSVGVMIREITSLYAAFSRGLPSPLPEPSAQFAAFLRWESEQITGERSTRLAEHWARRLEGVPNLNLPTDLFRPSTQGFAGRRFSVDLPLELVEALESLGRQRGATLFTTLLCAFEVLLSRHSGQSDFAVGVPVANRSRLEHESLIGCLVNVLAIRARLSGNPTFSDLVREDQAMIMDDFAHQSLPFERVVELIRPERDPSLQPIFQVMFAFQSAPKVPMKMAGLRMERAPIDFRISKFDLSVEFRDEGGTPELVWEYATDLFRPDTVARMATHFLNLLRAVAESPESRISDLPLMSRSEVRLVTEVWSGKSAAARAEGPDLLTRIADQARVRPDRIALSMGEKSMSYSELERTSNQLAWTLRGRGVRRGSPVALLMERSPEQIVSLLAIWKTGGAHLPLDSALPERRLRRMIETAGSTLVLSRQDPLGSLALGGVESLALDADAEEIAACSQEPLDAQISPRDLAYVMFTSGSTGEPKGVAVEHGSLLGFATAARDLFETTPEDRVLQFASLSFDASLEEILPALISGATVVLRTDEMMGSPEHFLRSCGELDITVLDLPTALWHELVDAADRIPPSVRLIIIGGERALPGSLQRWRQRAPSGVRLLNTYGPTECTVAVLAADLTGYPDEKPTRAVPIGKPLACARAYVLDLQMCLVPPGALGELHIGGDGLARGYINRPDLTAERFVPDPFGSANGDRLCRTGDWVRHLADGTIEFHGRRDRQVKIRGFRIELQEIESALQQHRAVREAVVSVREEGGEARELVAHVVPREGESLSPGDLHDHLSATLPAHMVPSAFVITDQIPRTASGKVDIASLPAPGESRSDQAKGSMQPRNKLERELQSIWTEVLGVEGIGVHDNFFALGGHSLMATQVMARIHESLNRDLSLATLFKMPTIAEIAEHIQSTSGEGESPERAASADLFPAS